MAAWMGGYVREEHDIAVKTPKPVEQHRPIPQPQERGWGIEYIVV